VGGGIGAAPLIALAAELAEKHEAFDFYAGFRIPFTRREEQSAFLGPAERYARRLVIAVEEAAAAPDRDGEPPLQGLVPAFLDPGKYRAVCACGPEAMLRAVADKCAAAAVPCHVSLERRMACGVGACLGCTVPTAAGNRRCCTDGPVFSAEAITL
jgi:dihydroorotate dehydrogenase electron transfer subunit